MDADAERFYLKHQFVTVEASYINPTLRAVDGASVYFSRYTSAASTYQTLRVPKPRR